MRVRIVESLSVRESLGGRSSMTLGGWLRFLPPAALLVMLQEIGTPFPHWWYALFSAGLQHAAVGVVLLVVARARRNVDVVPRRLMFLLWIVVGVVRGIVGGLVVAATTDVNPEFLERSLAWIAISVVWTPLLVYVAAQTGRRRELMDDWLSRTEQLDVERSRARRSSAELQARLVSTVRDSVLPVIVEIQRSLAALADGISVGSLNSISDRLRGVSTDAALIIADTSRDAESTIPLPPHRRATVFAATEFHRTRPFYMSALTVLALAAITLPDSIRLGGLPGALETLIALFAVMLTLLGAFLLSSRLAARSTARRSVPVSFSFVGAAIASELALLLIPLYPFGIPGLVLQVSLPLSVIIAAATISIAAGVGIANENLAESIRVVDEEIESLRARSAELDDEARAQVSALLHGPVLGRLSACVMALNFHASDPTNLTPESNEQVTRQVLDHLALAARDMELLSAV